MEWFVLVKNRDYMVNVGISGSSGRIGKTLIKLLNGHLLFNLSGTFNSKKNKVDLDKFCRESDLIIDFSSSLFLDTLLEHAIKHQNKLFIGTTGLTERQFISLKNASTEISIFYTENTSILAYVVADISAQVASLLKGFDIGVIDIHHKRKRDIPSGTASMIQNFIKAKIDGNVAMSSLRIGQNLGEHCVIFDHEEETLEIKHKVLNKTLFAKNALVISEWFIGQQKSLYTMKNFFHAFLNRVY